MVRFFKNLYPCKIRYGGSSIKGQLDDNIGLKVEYMHEILQKVLNFLEKEAPAVFTMMPGRIIQF